MITTIALGYLRCSTDRQDLETQRETVRRAAAYHQLATLECFEDSDTSGGMPFAERPEAARLLRRIEELNSVALLNQPAPAITVVVPKVDRLGRDTIDISETANLVHTLGVRLLFLDINVDTRSAMGRAFMQIAAVFAELERNRIRERILEALATKRGKGQLTGTLPYGWDAEPTGETTPKGVPIRRLVPNLTEQRWILHMHAMRAAGGSYYAIAQKLNELGCPTKRAGEVLTLRGKNKTTAPGIVRSGWRSGNVQKVLTNQTVQSWLASQAAQAAAA